MAKTETFKARIERINFSGSWRAVQVPVGWLVAYDEKLNQDRDQYGRWVLAISAGPSLWVADMNCLSAMLTVFVNPETKIMTIGYTSEVYPENERTK